jgi:hypothetical protein
MQFKDSVGQFSKIVAHQTIRLATIVGLDNSPAVYG